MTLTLRSLRGPSNSQKKIPCRVESPSVPSITGLVSDGPTKPAPPGPALRPLGLATLPLSREEIAYPLIREAHTASSLASATAVRAWRTAGAAPVQRPEGDPGVVLAPLPAATVPEPIEAVIARRGSTRRFPLEAIAREHLATILHLAWLDAHPTGSLATAADALGLAPTDVERLCAYLMDAGMIEAIGAGVDRLLKLGRLGEASAGICLRPNSRGPSR